MKSQAYFEKIHKEIESRLENANKSIRIAVAWFTDQRLFHIIYEKAKVGLEVELLVANHEINEGKLKYNDLNKVGGEFHWIGEGKQWEPLMHNKFCIIDNEILIFGSYNWTKKAKSNHESITVIEEDYSLISDFNKEFDKIKNKYFEENLPKSLDWPKILIRIDTLLNLIKLEDKDDIKYQIKKIKKLIPVDIKGGNAEKLTTAIACLENDQYRLAVQHLEQLSREFKQVDVYMDPEIPALQLEIRGLEFQVASLEDEKIEIEKLIRTFDLKYNNELGGIIKEILHFKMLRAKEILYDREDDDNAQKEYKEAKSDYREFNNAYNEKIKIAPPAELSKDLQKELKQNYRKATKLCHPDKVADEQKELAQKIFNELKTAYDNNNLKKVNSILADLEKGIFKSQGETVTEKDKLKYILRDLMQKRNALEEMLVALKQTDAYVKIKGIKNWDSYFEQCKKEYEAILEELKHSKTI